MASKIRVGARVRWADREYEVWSLSKRRGYVWLTRDGHTFEARAANCEVIERPAVPRPVRDTATVTQLHAPAAKRPPKVTSEDRARIDAAIRSDAAAHAGVIDPNRVRAALSGPDGLTVSSQALSARYSQLAAAEDIESLGYVGVNDDTRSGNAGKPQRHWRWVGPLPGQAVTA